MALVIGASVQGKQLENVEIIGIKSDPQHNTKNECQPQTFNSPG
jgi:hypothetical protein